MQLLTCDYGRRAISFEPPWAISDLNDRSHVLSITLLDVWLLHAYKKHLITITCYFTCCYYSF